MTFFSVLLSLMLEQYRPVNANHWTQRMMRYWIDRVPNYCDTGEISSAKVTIMVLIIPPVMLVLMEYLDCLFLYGISSI